MARLVVTLSFLAAAPHICHAEFIFLGPTPYKSAADSPFPVDGSNPKFYLEDFEDGALNTPGITTSLGIGASIVGPSATTDSVDGDDGAIDGSGNNGWSLRHQIPVDFGGPPFYSGGKRFDFNATTLGFLPNAFGIVWTDGPPGTRVRLFAFDENNMTVGRMTYPMFGDLSDDGATNEDQFIGVMSSTPFAGVLVFSEFAPATELPPDLEFFAELDHVQYGFIVPEPNAILLPVIGIAYLALTSAVVVRRLRRQQSDARRRWKNLLRERMR